MSRPSIIIVNGNEDDRQKRDEFSEEKEQAVIRLLNAIATYSLQHYPLIKERAQELRRLYGLD